MNLIKVERFKQITASFKGLKPIIVVGDVGVDKYTFGDVKRISPEAPVPVLEVQREWHKLGLAANISDNLNALEIPSNICGIIGKDFNAQVLRDLLKKNNLGDEGLVATPDYPTIFKERVTTNIQQICRIDYEDIREADSQITDQLVEKVESFAEKSGAVIIEDYGKGCLTKRLVEKVIGIFREQNKVITVDPSRTTPPLYYEGVDLLKPNLKEATIMTEVLGYRKLPLEKMAEILVEKLKLNKLVITLGGEGMALLDTQLDGKLHIIPTMATEVFDVSGAGDTAISAITAALMTGATLEEAAWVGNCASGVVVAKKGTATVTLPELHEFYERMAQKFNKQ